MVIVMCDKHNLFFHNNGFLSIYILSNDILLGEKNHRDEPTNKVSGHRRFLAQAQVANGQLYSVQPVSLGANIFLEKAKPSFSVLFYCCFVFFRDGCYL